MRCSSAITTVITMTREPTLMAPLCDEAHPQVQSMPTMNTARSRPFVTSTHSDHHHSRRWDTRWLAHVPADVALLVLHLAGGANGVDVGGAVHHLAAELRTRPRRTGS